MNAAELPRRTAAAALAATALVASGWLGPWALAVGLPGIVLWLALLSPLLLGLRGVLHGKLHTGRWLSLLLPFYGAGVLVAAAGDAGGRGWLTATAFCLALAFAAVLSWVRRAARSIPPPPPT